ncbi:MAG: hypothetical protein HC836_50580, partial [Richelia sp. RM2_1_2]|nr:hypothetical protein [Richelia sp. RM2_1_2]
RWLEVCWFFVNAIASGDALRIAFMIFLQSLVFCFLWSRDAVPVNYYA